MKSKYQIFIIKESTALPDIGCIKLVKPIEVVTGYTSLTGIVYLGINSRWQGIVNIPILFPIQKRSLGRP